MSPRAAAGSMYVPFLWRSVVWDDGSRVAHTDRCPRLIHTHLYIRIPCSPTQPSRMVVERTKNPKVGPCG